MRKYRVLACNCCGHDIQPGETYDVITFKDGSSESYCRRIKCQMSLSALSGYRSGGIKRPVIA